MRTKLRVVSLSLIFILTGFGAVSAQSGSPAVPSATASPTPFIPQAAVTTDLEKTLGLHFFGDMRFRFRYLVQGQDYAPTFNSATTLWIDHEVNYRIRARVGVEKDFGDEAEAGIAVISFGDGDPTDPYWTLTGGATFLGVGLDLAYIDWHPHFLDQKITFTLGKYVNPLTYSPITWDENVTPSGMAFKAQMAENTRFTVVYNRLEDNGPATIEGAGADPFQAAFQLRQDFKLPDFQVGLTAGYQYVSNVASFETNNQGVTTYLENPSNPPGAPLSITSKGMIGDATNGYVIPDIHMIEGILNVSHNIGEEKIPVLWTLHVALNLTSFTLNATTNPNIAVNNPSWTDSNDLALFAGVKVGKVERWGDWAGGLEWGYIQPDAVFSAFNDPNPGLGHNNNIWIMGEVDLGLDKDFYLSAMEYVDWHVDYNILATQPTNVFGTTSQDPILNTLVDLTAKL